MRNLLLRFLSWLCGEPREGEMETRQPHRRLFRVRADNDGGATTHDMVPLIGSTHEGWEAVGIEASRTGFYLWEVEVSYKELDRYAMSGKSTFDWLKALGAKRPMAPACDQILVLGEWVAGFYPIEWMVVYDRLSRDFNGNLMNPAPMEQWRVFGHETKYPLTEADCKWILANVSRKGE